MLVPLRDLRVGDIVSVPTVITATVNSVNERGAGAVAVHLDTEQVFTGAGITTIEVLNRTADDA